MPNPNGKCGSYDDKNINKEDFSVENLKSFADYAVDNGIIDDTDIARGDITKSFG